MSMVEPMLDSLQKTIAIAARANVLTLYARQVYDRSKLTPLQLEQYDLDGKFITCDVNTDGPDFYRITPAPDIVFTKYNYDVFSNPNFEKTLIRHGIKTLVITGMDTMYCVETAIRRGFDLGYKIVVAEDLVAQNAKHQHMHNRTFELIGKTFGIITDSAELNRLWA